MANIDNSSLERYSIITEKNPREITLLRGNGCKWLKCRFCNYHLDGKEVVPIKYRVPLEEGYRAISFSEGLAAVHSIPDFSRECNKNLPVRPSARADRA